MTRVAVVDPSAWTPPYDHALCAALARAGAEVELVTSRFAYGDVPAADGYVRQELFYRRARGGAGGAGGAGARTRRLAKLATHVSDMRALAGLAAAAEVVHFQWLGMPWLDVALLPDRPLVLTAHDLLPREPRPGQLAAQRRLLARMDAVIAHSAHGRAQLVDRVGLDSGRVHVVHHGALKPGPPTRLPAELTDTGAPVVLCFGLLRPYKGIDTLLEAWRGITGAQLWIVGRPMMELPAVLPAGAELVTRFVSDGEAAALFARADVIVLPYARTERFDMSGVLATALGTGTASVVTDVGSFGEVAATGAARLVAPDDPVALHHALRVLVADPDARARLGAAARAAAAGPYSWDAAARATLAVYLSARG